MSASNADNAGAQFRADGTHVSGPQPDAEVICVNSTASLLAAVPVLLKFEPSEPNLVVLGTVAPRSRVAITIRYDISGPQCGDVIARHSASILAAQGINEACTVGYGAADLVTPVTEALRARFARAGITVREALRGQDGRYWSYICTDPGCCPPEGKEFDPKTHPLTRRHADLVLASREALAATVAPVTGGAAQSMRRATRAARQRAAGIVTGAGQGNSRQEQRGAQRRALLQYGLRAVASALDLYRAGLKFESHKDAAWLALSLKTLRIRDDAWARMLPEHREAHLRLWTDLTTLAQPGYVAAPAALLAFTAWQDGDGALANVALDRALADDPRYSMALLLREALDAGAPPSMARLPMTPEEVAAAYGQNEQAEEDEQAGETAAQATDPDQAGDGSDADGEEEDDDGSAVGDDASAAPADALAGAVT